MVPKRDGLGLSFFLLSFAFCLVSPPAFGNDRAQTPGVQAPAIQTTTSLVLVDALAEDKKSGAPIPDLQQDDFLLRDNGKAVSIASFNRGKDQKLRPVQFWFVLMCNEERHFQAVARRRSEIETMGQWGVSFLAGKVSELQPALEHLHAGDTVGVAHWCDTGQSEIDVTPSKDPGPVLAAMDRIAQQKAVEVDQLNGDAAQRQLVGLINNVAQTAFPEPFLAIIFVGGKHDGSSGGKSAEAWSGYMEVSSMDFGMAGGEGSSGESGNVKYAIHGSDFASRLGMYLECVHERYEIGFVPGKHEKKLHHVSVVLAKEAKEKYPNAALRYREVYSDTSETESVDTANRAMDWKQLDSRMRAAVQSPDKRSELSFEVQRTGSAQGKTERFLLKIASSGLTWSVLPNGDRRSVVTAVVASYSSKGQPVGVAVQELEIVQSFERLAALKTRPVEFPLTAAVVKGAARVRLLVRDVATGHIGTQDVVMAPSATSVQSDARDRQLNVPDAPPNPPSTTMNPHTNTQGDATPDAKPHLQLPETTEAGAPKVQAQEPVMNVDTPTAKPEAAQAPPIRSTTRLVQVSVVVTDKKGEPITGLKKEDFTLLDEGKPQEIAFFSAEAPPLPGKPPALPPNVFTNRFDLKGQDPGSVTIVLFDTLNTAVQDQAYVRAQVIKFLRDLKPQDHVAVYGLTTELLLLHEFTQDSSVLVAAAEQFQPKQQAPFDASHPAYFDVPALRDDPMWMRFQAAVNQTDARIADQYMARRAEMTANAFEAIANHVATIPGRKNLVWVSGSFPLSIIVESIQPDRPSETTGQYSQAAARALNRANVALYPVDATGVVGNAAMDPSNGTDFKCIDCIPEAPGPKSGMQVREDNLTSERMMADATGGQAFYGSNDITKALKTAFDDGRYAYAIAFYPDHGKWDGKYRKIKLRLKENGGARLRYRSGYIAEPEFADSETQAKTELQQAAASPLDATSLGLILTGKVSGPPSDRKLELHIGLDPKQLLLRDEEQHKRGAVDLYFVQRDAKGETVAAETQRIRLNLEEKQYEYLEKAGLVLARHLTIAPRAAELRVLARDVSSEALGSVSAPVSTWFQGQEDAAAPVKLEIPK